MLRSVAGALVSLAAGVAVGLIARAAFWVPFGPARTPSGAHVETEKPGSAAEEGEIATERETGGEASPIAAKSPSGREELSKALSELIDAVPIPPLGERRGVIWGTVVTEFGKPLPGAEIRLWLFNRKWWNPRDVGWTLFRDGDIEERVFTYVCLSKQASAAERTALADERGAFRFEGVPEAAEYGVTAALEGWEIRPLAGRSRKVRAGERIDFLARERLTLSASVACLLPDGTEPERASVDGANTGSFLAEWSPEKRTLGFSKPGTYILTATTEVDGEPYVSDPVVVAVPRKEAEPVVLKLRVRPGIYGQVIPPSGTSLDGVSVYATPVTRSERPEHADSDRAITVRAGPEDAFRYSFEDLTPGLYYLAVFWPSYGNHRCVLGGEAFVEVRGERVRQDLELRVPDRRSAFSVRAYAPAVGELAQTDLRVSLESAWRNSRGEVLWRYVDLRSFRDEGGFCWYFPSETSGYREAGELLGYLLQVCASGYDSRAPRQFSDSRSFVREGCATFRLRPRRYELEIYLRLPRHFARYGSQPAPRTLHRSSVEVRPGANRISVTLPPLYDLVVSCPNAAEGEKLTLCRQRQVSGWTVPLSSERTAVFPGLPKGTYTLRMEGPGGGEMDVALPGPEAIEFRPAPFNALRIEWPPPEGSYLRELGIECPARIVGVGSELLEDAGDLRRVLEASGEEEEVYVIVDDYEKRRAVAVDPKRFLWEMDRPGLFVPARRR